MADVVDKFNVRFWNGFYYCKVAFPDGFSTELKSADDLDYTEWQVKIKDAWTLHNTPVPGLDECQCPDCKTTFICPNRGI
jgi:hypothetical protein